MTTATNLTTNKPALPVGIWSLDPSQTTISVTAKKLKFISVPASLTVSAGTIEIDADHRDVNVEVVAEAASYDSGNSKRDEHVRGADFLDADVYPTIVFRTRSVSAAADGAFQATGSVAVKGQTTPLEVDIDSVEFDATTGAFAASATIDRTAIGVDKMPSFVIGRNLTLKISATAIRQ